MTKQTLLASIVREIERQYKSQAGLYVGPTDRLYVSRADDATCVTIDGDVDLDALAAAIERDMAAAAPLKWSSEPPTAPGKHWFRLSPKDDADVVDVTGHGTAFPTGDEIGFRVATIGGQWAGPLKPPEE